MSDRLTPPDKGAVRDQEERLLRSERTHYCSKCAVWTDHRDYAHDLRVCSCGNRFDGDNFCMVSACQEET